MILHTDTYDPLADEPSRPNYFSKKDAKWLALMSVVFLALLAPIYIYFKKNRDRHLCKSYLGAIYQGIALYGENNDSRFPPLYVRFGQDTPLMDDAGRPFTWASLVQPYLNGRTLMSCPAATQEEEVSNQHSSSSKLTLKSSYGMYAPLSAYPKDGVPNETQTVLVSETSNAGSQDSFDPMPLKTSKSGAKVQDGFVIGFEDSNGFPTNKSTLVSRLAFPGTKNGKYDPKGEARHLTGIFYVTAAGSLKSLKPDDIAVTRLGKSSDLTGLWSTPIALNR